MAEVQSQAGKLMVDDVTDARYQPEDKKRKISQEIDNFAKDKCLREAKKKYAQTK